MPLPPEILSLVFSHLEANDLWHCQLTSKQWHKASLRLLYTNLFVDTIETFSMYVRTITYSPQLGKYLKTIDFKSLFNGPESDNSDRIGLLDTVIEYGSNITKMDGVVSDDRFWSRLMYATTQGQLSYLETLPRTSMPVPKSFIDTTLVFKNTLTSLWVYCNTFQPAPQHIYSAPDENVYNQIGQFKNLNTLYIDTYRRNPLSYFDRLIDNFHSIKTLDFSFTSGFYRKATLIKPYTMLLPRPDIQSLKCYWGQIKRDRQLEYLMCKFPNLQRLVVETWPNGIYNFDQSTLRKFIQYALSVPDFQLRMDLTKEQTLDVWVEFIKAKNRCKNITFDYFDNYRAPAMYQLDVSAELGLGLRVNLHRLDELPYIEFLTEVGYSLRSLRIVRSKLFQWKHDKPRTIAWIFDILQLCSLLEELTVSGLESSLSIHHTSQYPSLKKLAIDGFRRIKSIRFLHWLSLNLPNLCQLSLTFGYSNMGAVVINMPHTSFDLLIWTDTSCQAKLFKGPEVYIKLNTDKGREYYLGEKSMLVPISHSRYLLSPKNVRFEILCKQLKELRIRRRVLPGSDSNFVF